MRKLLTVLVMALALFLMSGCGPEDGDLAVQMSKTETGRPALPLVKAAGSRPKRTRSRERDDEVRDMKDGTERPDAELTLVVAGDVLSHDDHWKAAMRADGSFDYGPQFQDIRELLSAGDLTLVNLETPVSGEEYGYRGFPKFNAPLDLAETLKEIGVDLVITANNHILDNGVEGLDSALDNLDAVGLMHAGAARSPEEAGRPLIVEINGIRTGFAATTARVGMTVPEEYQVPLNQEPLMRKKIRDLRAAGAELIVFHIHWGKEYTEYPSKIQMELCRILEEEGVDIVIGSHPHRLQPAELRPIEYLGRTKDQAILWSTANLSWAEPVNKAYVDTGAVFRIRVQRILGEIKITGLDHDLVYNLLEKTENGIRHTKIIPEADREKYRKSHPQQYSVMTEEFKWAREVLKSTVNGYRENND